jgi:hypothetical protein
MIQHRPVCNDCSSSSTFSSSSSNSKVYVAVVVAAAAAVAVDINTAFVVVCMLPDSLHVHYCHDTHVVFVVYMHTKAAKNTKCMPCSCFQISCKYHHITEQLISHAHLSCASIAVRLVLCNAATKYLTTVYCTWYKKRQQQPFLSTLQGTANSRMMPTLSAADAYAYWICLRRPQSIVSAQGQSLHI